MKRVLLFMLIIVLLPLSPASAADQITFLSQPESIAIFLNNIAYVRDSITLPQNSEAEIILPGGVFPDTLILTQESTRVPSYRLRSMPDGGWKVLLPPTSSTVPLRLDYLTTGIQWKPTYDLFLGEDAPQSTIQLDFFVEIFNTSLVLQDVETQLVAGRVDTTQPVQAISQVTTNQYIAGYSNTNEQRPQSPEAAALSTGAVAIQHVYNAGNLTLNRGETLYTEMLRSDFDARRVLLWNASTSQQADVIYKVRNDSDMPLPEGVVRAYQNQLFIGSDFVETTPVGSEGSITVGGLQNLRVNRAATETALTTDSDVDRLHEIELTLSNFGSDEVTVEVVDQYPERAFDFEFSEEPTRQAGNLFRWEVQIPSDETVTLRYQYVTE